MVVGSTDAGGSDFVWDPRFSPRGVGGPVYSLAAGASLYAGGSFTTAGDELASNVASWDGIRWRPLATGVDGTVSAVAWDGNNLYAGGTFSSAGGAPASHVAKWDGLSWSALGGGTDGDVRALAWGGGALYAGGTFTTAGGQSASHVARWDGTAWSALDIGTDGDVNALQWAAGSLYAAGTFSTAGGVAASRIAAWNGNSWTSLGSGVSCSPGTCGPSVVALAWDGANLYAGGEFDLAGSQPVSGLARWNGGAWSAFGTGAYDVVTALTWDGTYLNAGVRKTSPFPGNVLERWDVSGATTGYVPLLEAPPSALAWGFGRLYLGGSFGSAGNPSTAVSFVASWDGSAAFAPVLAGGGQGIHRFKSNYPMQALAWDGSSLYAAGSFDTAGDVSVSAGKSALVGRWNGSSWEDIGQGNVQSCYCAGNTCYQPYVYAMASAGTALYVAGQFGYSSTENIAKWDGVGWTFLGDLGDPAFCGNDWAAALAVNGSDVYAGGYFSQAGGVPVSNIARWDGAQWNGLGSGTDADVLALVWDGTGLYAGGIFANAGGVPASHVARWDGSGWSALGAGMDGDVQALAWDGTSLYAGGSFTNAGGVPAAHVARWDGSSWAALGSGTDGNVSALICDGQMLYAGGAFQIAGGVAAGSLARWNGASWSPVGFGVDGTVRALALDASSRSLYVGGDFQVAGRRPSSHVARAVLPAVDYVFGQGLGQPNDNRVKVYEGNGAPTVVDFLAFAAGAWGVNVAAGPLDDTTDSEILTGPGPGAVFGPHVRSFQHDGTPMPKVSFYAYGTLRYGVNVASSFLDGDAYAEILSGAGPGVVFGPHVRGFDFDGTALGSIPGMSYFAYSTLKYGVNVAAGSMDADAFGEILTGPGPGVVFGPQVRGWNYDDRLVTSIAKINYLPFATPQYGVNLTAGDFEGDGYAEIASTPGPGAGSSFPSRFLGHDYDGTAIAFLGGFDVTGFPTSYGGRVGAGDVAMLGRDQLLCGAGRDPAADSTVAGYDYDGVALNALTPIAAPFGSATFGVNIGASPLGY
ncbi:MAG: hypothetical protein U0166_13815 [Acidobacteriota bacterium]